MFFSTNEGVFCQGRTFSLWEAAFYRYIMPSPQKLALVLTLVQKNYSTVTKYRVKDERVHSKDFLTNKMKASIFHFREQGLTEIHPLFITSVGSTIIKVTEV